MKRLLKAILLMLPALPASAELDIGALAPDFTTQASLGGKVFEYKLSSALENGPVVL